MSVDDFYKVYGYACLYATFEKVPITGLTVSFVENRCPRKLIAHLKEVRGYTVEQTESGIYTVSGDILPIQVIDSRRLSPEENLWLKSLSDRLNVAALGRVTTEIDRQGKAARTGTYLYAIARANTRIIQEAMRMSERLTLEKVLEDAGLIAKWEALGEERKAFNIARNMVNIGLPFETVVSATQLDPEKVKILYKKD